MDASVNPWVDFERLIGRPQDRPFANSEAATSSCEPCIQDSSTDEPSTHIQMCDGVIDILAELFNVDGRELRGPRRSSKPVARVRQIGMYTAHVTLGMRVAEVAEGFGRDRSTVMYACHLIEDLRDDRDIDAIIGRTEALIRIAFRAHIDGQMRGAGADG